jgi:hypothetical protein
MAPSIAKQAEHLRRLADAGESFLASAKYPPIDLVGTYEGCPRFVDPVQLAVWRTRVFSFLRALNLTDDTYPDSIRGVLAFEKEESVRTAVATIRALAEDIEVGAIPLTAQSYSGPLVELESLFNRFHLVARQMLQRYGGRPTLAIGDEYDVQDLLHSLLRLYFDDIRDEEFNPSYGGGSTRSDFLLKAERMVVEVKKTRDGLKDKDVGDQLVIDIAKYRTHPDCRAFVAFVYDPDQRLKNPRGLETDLTDSKGELPTHVYIRPI